MENQQRYHQLEKFEEKNSYSYYDKNTFSVLLINTVFCI